MKLQIHTMKNIKQKMLLHSNVGMKPECYSNMRWHKHGYTVSK